jgi:hypothetical protein
MTRESFADRVEALRDSWAERRRIAGFAGAHDLASQLELLQTLHGWAAEAVADIAAVYGPALPIVLSPRPEPPGERASFSVAIAGDFGIAVALAERRRVTGPRWHVSVLVRSPGSGPVAHAGPERRNGQWTRGRLEDILLSVLGAYERSLGNSAARPEPPSGTAMPSASTRRVRLGGTGRA